MSEKFFDTGGRCNGVLYDATRMSHSVVVAHQGSEEPKGFKLKALLTFFHNQSLKPDAFKLGSSLHRPTGCAAKWSSVAPGVVA